MEALIGMSPQEPEVEDGGKKDRVPAGAPFTWIAANFAHCSKDADDEVIQRYARVYMWYVSLGLSSLTALAGMLHGCDWRR